MHAAQASALVANLGSYNGRRFFRQHFSRFLHVLVAATGGLQGQDAVVRVPGMDVRPKTVGHIDHAQRPMRRLRHPGGGAVHAVFQPPVLLGVPDVPFALAPQSIIVPAWRVRQVQLTATQDDRGAGLRAQVRRRDEDDMQRWRALRMEQLPLIAPGLHVPLDRGFCEVWPWEGVVLARVAILAMGAPPGGGAGGGEGQRRRIPALGKQGQGVLPRPRHGVVVATVPVQPPGGP
jgi:hypothetical protein